MTVTRDQALDAFGECIAEAELGIRRGTVAEAAARAHTPTGPSLDELERRITEIRAADRRAPRTPAHAAQTPAPRRARVSKTA